MKLLTKFAPIICILGCLLGLFAYLLHLEQRLFGGVGFGMDDAWIHVTVARNFLTGLGWGIEPGRILSVSTSPTWTLLVAAGLWFGNDPVKTVLLISLLCSAVALLLVYTLTFKFTGKRSIGIATALVTLINPIVIWGLGSGMEIPLALVGLLLILHVYYSAEANSNRRKYLLPLILVLGAITRPELFVLIPLALLDTYRINLTLDPRRASGIFFWQLLIVVLALLPYFGFNIMSHGKIFPTTYYAKTSVRGVGLSSALESRNIENIFDAAVTKPLWQLQDVSKVLKRHNLLGFLLVFVGLLPFFRSSQNNLLRRGWLLPLGFFVLPYAMGLSAPTSEFSNHAYRYYAIFPVLAALMTGLGISFADNTWPRLRVRYWALAPLMYFGLHTFDYATRHVAIDADSTRRLYEEMPKWLAANLPEDAKLATNDIGGVGYFVKRPLIDIMGLASPEIWSTLKRGYGEPQDLQKLRAYLKTQGVTHLLVSPHYYQGLITKRGFRKVKAWKEKIRHGRLISPQILFRVEWEKVAENS